MSRESLLFFNVTWVKQARLAITFCFCLILCLAIGCSSEKPVKKAPDEKPEKIVTEMNIKTDSDKPEKEKEDELETLPFDDDQAANDPAENGTPALNGPD